MSSCGQKAVLKSPPRRAAALRRRKSRRSASSGDDQISRSVVECASPSAFAVRHAPLQRDGGWRFGDGRTL